MRYPPSSLGPIVYRAVSLGVTEGLDDDEAMNRRIITGATLFQALVAPTWVLLYLAFDEPLAAMSAGGVTVGAALSLGALWRLGHWTLFRRLNYAWWFLTAFALMASLGGFALGSAVIIWSIFGPLMAILEGRVREAVIWSLIFVVSTVVAGLIQPWLRTSNNLPEGVRTALFVMDIVVPSVLIFLLLAYFVHQKHLAIDLMRRNRELESAYLAQEINLRQSERLATVGRLSSGLAHELNNPSAAAQQATRELTGLLAGETSLMAAIEAVDLSDEEHQALMPYAGMLIERVNQPEFMDPLIRSDRESEVQAVLETIGVVDDWEIAPAIVDLGIYAVELKELRDKVRTDRLAAVMTEVSLHFRRQQLLGGLDESMSRIVELVTALKTYTYLDQAPRQAIDLHEGLDSTLAMLRNRLKRGVTVNRSYGDDVPPIEANGSELNQVWTNIIDNAIHAMDGRGVIDISTQRRGQVVVIDITDDGPGVPEEIADQIFDPFVTTKGPGEGTGLGLNISHNIVTQNHGGEIRLSSTPGETRFTICLPIEWADAPGANPEVA